MPVPDVDRYRSEDRRAVDALYRRVFGTDAAESSRLRWELQYRRNPNNPGGEPEIWVAREGPAIVGQYATMPVRLAVKGREIKVRGPGDAMDAGVVLLPEDRKNQGAVLHFSVRKNVTLPTMDTLPRVLASGLRAPLRSRVASMSPSSWAGALPFTTRVSSAGAVTAPGPIRPAVSAVMVRVVSMSLALMLRATMARPWLALPPTWICELSTSRTVTLPAPAAGTSYENST